MEAKQANKRHTSQKTNQSIHQRIEGQTIDDQIIKHKMIKSPP
jgi:hypothetical protein